MGSEQQNESLDFAKIYIWILLAFSTAVIVVCVYYYFLWDKYNKSIALGKVDLEYILENEKEIPVISDNDIPRAIDNVHSFFKRTVRGIPEPELEEGAWEVKSIGDVEFSEKNYMIHFEQGISRSDLGRYIFQICKAKPFLRLKAAELEKFPNSAPFEDKWKASIILAFRRPMEE